jgi:hypothetical protein
MDNANGPKEAGRVSRHLFAVPDTRRCPVFWMFCDRCGNSYRLRAIMPTGAPIAPVCETCNNASTAAEARNAAARLFTASELRVAYRGARRQWAAGVVDQMASERTAK